MPSVESIILLFGDSFRFSFKKNLQIHSDGNAKSHLDSDN